MRLSKQLRSLDWVLIGAVLMLTCIGLLFIASASRAQPVGGDPLFYVKRQAMWAVVSIVAMIVVIFVDYAWILRLAPWIYAANLGLLGLVLVIGHSAGGAQRWIQIGGYTLQPSEFAKVAMIITFAAFLAGDERSGQSAGPSVARARDLVAPALYMAVPWFLVFRQPDLGTSLVFGAIFLAMLFVAGANPRLLFGVTGGGLGAVGLAIFLHYRFGLPIPLREYQIRRITAFVQPGKDLQLSGYHTHQSQIAIGSGRWFGKGIMAGSQNQLNFVPQRHTDFIFSVIGEEVGFFGSILVVGLFALILWRAVLIASRSKDMGGTLLVMGSVAMLAFHVFVNIGMASGIMPVTGLPLPFVSSGGSNLLANCIAIGLILNVHLHRHKINF